MGLAPGEVVSVGIRTRQSRTFSSLVRDAAEASKTSSHSHPHTAAWGLRGQEARRLVESLDRVAPDRVSAILQPRVRTVHVFAGTHVEAVPGSCVLPGIPPGLAVIVPGATQYVKQMP